MDKEAAPERGLICPLDGRPCDPNCPDRYQDDPAGGCLTATLMEHSDAAFIIKKTAPSAGTPGTAKGGTGSTRSTSSLYDNKEEHKG